ncbi:putative DNA primase/helicase [Nitrosospira sp. Nsp14]|uniref:DUF3631 domain-containing protein n=1 Tax=Nitrosospira sp. Nsp14 TaxID=1855333 RepID=UPI0008ED4244|nr:DUF3631 domain-containing protein [Nitrosospira sp. Nsp14]SFH38298.1 putative DNA primase/helicase [Nitrosospira sp. Nsp14]
MTETAKEGALRLVGFMLAKGYRPEALHEYTDQNGRAVYHRMRLRHPATGEKCFLPMKFEVESYVLGVPEFPAGKPLYRLHQLHLRPNDVVFLVEGEKCADELETLGLLATTSGGADSFEKADFKPLAGRNVVLWRDNDEAGKRWALAITRKLRALGCKLQHIEIDELALAEKEDCVDWLAKNPDATAAAVSALSMVAPDPESKDEAIERLAALPPFEYDRVRKDEAKILRIRADTLDKLVRGVDETTTTDESPFTDPEPWPEPIHPAQLLNEIVMIIRRFIVLDSKQAHAVALWVAFTWLIDVVKVAPLIIINAPERECGKSQLLSLLLKLSRKALSTANMRSATLFRIAEKWHPSIMIDEADTFIKTDEEMSGLINAGHTRDSAFAWRLVGDDHEPKAFSVWGAKAFAGISLERHLPPATMSRAIVIQLRRKLPNEKVSRLRHAENDLFADLASKLARFADDFSQQVQQAQPILPDSLGDREQDNWEPLLAIAECAGARWTKRATDAALKLSGNKSHELVSPTNELLSDIREIFENGPDGPISKIRYTDLMDSLAEDSEKSWDTYNRGKPITMRQVTNLLKPYGIKSKTIRFGFSSCKGFEVGQFADAFARYLPIPEDPRSQGNNSPKLNRGAVIDVTDAATRYRIASNGE